jgi:Membrane-bound metallopeptidase
VLQPFSYDAAHPYASGQHRGIDIGADSAGETVVAPSAGLISFAGTVPTSGKSVTIQTADGYSVTLTHLGSIVVAEGDYRRRAGRGRHGRPERHRGGGRSVRPSRDSRHR